MRKDKKIKNQKSHSETFGEILPATGQFFFLLFAAGPQLFTLYRCPFYLYLCYNGNN